MTLWREPRGLFSPFRDRSGRVVAVGRLSLAAVFLIALMLDPAWHADGTDFVVWLMAAYVLSSATLLGATWNSWWRDHRLAGPAHIVDILVFGAVVVLTHGYTTPFYTFSVFLILSPTIRWSWRETLLTAAAVCAIYFAGGLYAAYSEGLALEIDRVLIRTAYLIVFSLLLIWFGITQEAARTVRPKNVDQPLASAASAAKLAIDFILGRFPAQRTYFIYAEADEPWVHLLACSGGEISSIRFGPGEFGYNLEDDSVEKPLLYRAGSRHALALDDKLRPYWVPAPRALAGKLPANCPLTTGLLIPIRASQFSGVVVLDQVPGLCRDDLKEAKRVGEELSNLFNHYSALSNTAENAVEKAKVALSRDLHDSVLQSLSGVSFRLEALRSWIQSGRQANDEITKLQQQLAQEQKNVRRFIYQLQHGDSETQKIDITSSLEALLTELSRQWDIECEISRPKDGATAPAWMEHPLRQIVREAAANSVRHANARKLECELSHQGEMLLLSIRDDGSGFALQGQFDEPTLREKGLAPWSIYERVKGLGGNVSLFSNAGGSQLRLEIPMRTET